MQECVHFLLRASCAVARRGSAKERRISCQHFQITGIEERETIMASIQMPLKAEVQQKATETAEEDAVELDTTATHLVILDQPKAKQQTREAQNDQDLS